MKAKVEGFQRKLDQVSRVFILGKLHYILLHMQVNIGIVTYGLAFHLHKTTILRYPYHDEKYFEQVSAQKCSKKTLY